MKIGVFGLWHLGCVTAACLAKEGFQTLGIDPSEEVVNFLNKGKPPLFEPGLENLLEEGLKSGNLEFSINFDSLSELDVLWVCFDTPVDENDRADVDYVSGRIIETFSKLKPGCVVLISSQLPIGSIAKLEKSALDSFEDKKLKFACSPENLRLGSAIDVFSKADRYIIGVRDVEIRKILEPIFSKFTEQIHWMSIESAEMTKHAINSFLATSVTFINELSIICEKVGADAKEVEVGLKSDSRIGKKAYLSPGLAFAGGTLARDLNFLSEVARKNNINLDLVSGVIAANERHKNWSKEKILEVAGELDNKVIGLLGLTYKPGTNTLRRSSGVELSKWLLNKNAKVLAFDPEISEFPKDFENPGIELVSSIRDLINKSDLVFVSTNWPNFLEIKPSDFDSNKNSIIIDPTRFLNSDFSTSKNIQYFSIGKGVNCEA